MRPDLCAAHPSRRGVNAAPRDQDIVCDLNHDPVVADQTDVSQYDAIQSPPGFVMRLRLAATLIFLTAASSAHAQMTAPSTAGAKPKRVATVPVTPPPLQKPADTASTMAQAERLALQSNLARGGGYNSGHSGDVSERMVAAIKEYQKSKGGRPSGVLNPQERAVLAETARRRQDNVGWKIVTDPGTGVR